KGVMQRREAFVVDRLVEVDVAGEHHAQCGAQVVTSSLQRMRLGVRETVVEGDVERHESGGEAGVEDDGGGGRVVGDVRLGVGRDVPCGPDRSAHHCQAAYALREGGVQIQRSGDVGE